MTTHVCSTGPTCWVTCALVFIAWWLIASALLLGTWNKVIKAIAGVKAAKYWQALLLVATVAAFCAPRAYYMRKGGYRGHSCCQSDCQHGDGEKGDCPYSGKDKDSAAKKR